VRLDAGLGAGSGSFLVIKGCEILSGFSLLALMGVTVAGVLARSLFGVSFEMSEEYGGFLLVALTFLSMPVAFGRASFHQVDFVQARLSPRLRRALNVAFLALAVAACSCVAWYLIQFELFSWRSGNVSESTLGTPLWIPQAAMPVGMSLLVLVMLAKLTRLTPLARAPHDPAGPRS
jgi:TRAP-type C4-dicarboxylate transport system permease small subunit